MVSHEHDVEVCHVQRRLQSFTRTMSSCIVYNQDAKSVTRTMSSCIVYNRDSSLQNLENVIRNFHWINFLLLLYYSEDSGNLIKNINTYYHQIKEEQCKNIFHATCMLLYYTWRLQKKNFRAIVVDFFSA